MAETAEGAAPPKRTVVIAVDRSEQAEQAFQYYAERLHRPDNKVLILHCPGIPDSIFAHLHIGKKHTESSHEHVAKEMEKEKEKWTEVQSKYEALLKERNMSGEFICSPSHRPGEGIVKECDGRTVTMVILGTRGLGAVRRTIMGSVSDYVVHHAHCPVIVCRH